MFQVQCSKSDNEYLAFVQICIFISDNDKPAKLENHNATDCPFPTWIGDGVCDHETLIPACEYDGGMYNKNIRLNA